MKPTYETKRRVEGHRLAYYLAAADTAFWDSHWKAHLSPKTYTSAEQGKLGWFEEPFTRYLPRQGRILEAGCGLGQYVLALRARGYDVEGVEWSAETVQAVRELYPDLPIRVGDVTRLELPDGYYAGYISLGVVEHRREGPEPFLREAARVLAPDGAILVSVPHFHPLRRLKGRLGLYRERTDGLRFFQYAFTVDEFIAVVKKAGFEPIETFNYDALKGIKDEISLVRFLLRRRLVGHFLARLMNAWGYAQRRLGHMLLVVARRL